ncbi:amino acid ABC transporter permease [bacterium]|nr:amino acid ABC transporter permease [bacterium]MDD5919393.1 amino acid ABC transporter permease [bacterium]
MSFQVMLQQLGSGMLTSMLIFALTLLGSLPLALPVAFGRMSRFAPLRMLMRVYISFMRGTPLMLQLLVVYFGPWFLLKIPLSNGYRFYAVIIAFVLNYAAYFAEIYRAGIESIPRGQYEAAEVLGYSRGQTFRRIIFPQMVKRILPPVTNEIITLIKDTSLAFAIGVLEMFTLAKQIASAEKSMIPFVAAAAFYYIFNAVVAWAMERFERKLSYYR